MIPKRFSDLLHQLREEIEKTTDSSDLDDLSEQLDDLAGLTLDKLLVWQEETENDDTREVD